MSPRRKILLSVVLLFLFQNHSQGLNFDYIRIGKSTNSSEETDEIFKNHPYINKENVGFILYDIKTDRVITQFNRNSLFIPASTTKIFTTLASLKLLGADHRFNTTLEKSGTISEGSLHGNLYLKGGGDPNLTLSNIIQMVNALKKKGITRIDGKFIYDESLYADRNEIDAIMDDDAAYNTGLSALSLETNNIIAFWKQTGHKEPAKYYFVPSLPTYEIRNATYTKKENIEFKYAGNEEKSIWILSPKDTHLGLKYLPVKNPGLFTAMVFKKLASMESIELPDPVKGNVPWYSSELYIKKSESLLDLCRTILATSNNTMTENLLLSMTAKIGLKNSNLQTASSYLKDYFKHLPGDVNWDGFHLENGSGLTSSNRVSPEQLLAAVLFSEKLLDPDLNFEGLLPISGWSSILRTRLNDPVSAFRVHAKNGGIFYSTSLGGYLYAKSGKKYAFAFLITDYKARTAFEKMPNKHDRDVLSKTYGWSGTNQDFMDKTIKSWIEKY